VPARFTFPAIRRAKQAPMSSMRLRSATATLRSLPDEVLAEALAFLGARDLTRAARTSRTLLAVVDERWACWEAAFFELDPFGIVGAARVMREVRAGARCLDLARRFGDAACCACGAPTMFMSLGAVRRVCDGCPQPPGPGAYCPEHINRFVFAKKRDGVRVSSNSELFAAILAAEERRGDEALQSTIVVTQDINLLEAICTRAPFRIVGEGADGARPRLYCASNAAIMASRAVVEDLALLSGVSPEENDFDFYDGPHFPTVEVLKIPAFSADETSELGLSRHGQVIVRGCEIEANVGSAVLVDSGALSISENSISSDSYYGVSA